MEATWWNEYETFHKADLRLEKKSLKFHGIVLISHQRWYWDTATVYGCTKISEWGCFCFSYRLKGDKNYPGCLFQMEQKWKTKDPRHLRFLFGRGRCFMCVALGQAKLVQNLTRLFIIRNDLIHSQNESLILVKSNKDNILKLKCCTRKKYFNWFKIYIKSFLSFKTSWACSHLPENVMQRPPLKW